VRFGRTRGRTGERGERGNEVVSEKKRKKPGVRRCRPSHEGRGALILKSCLKNVCNPCAWFLKGLIPSNLLDQPCAGDLVRRIRGLRRVASSTHLEDCALDGLKLCDIVIQGWFIKLGRPSAFRGGRRGGTRGRPCPNERTNCHQCRLASTHWVVGQVIFVRLAWRRPARRMVRAPLHPRPRTVARWRVLRRGKNTRARARH